MNNSLRYYHERRNAIIKLMGSKCNKCGSRNKLEFDHIDKKSKSFDIGSYWSYSIQTLFKELSKCQLLCNPCHKDKNKTDNGEMKHGTYSMYKHTKCRCRPCMNAYNVIRKRWRATARLKGKIY